MCQWAISPFENELKNIWRECCGSGINVSNVTEETLAEGWVLSCISDSFSACFNLLFHHYLSNFHFNIGISHKYTFSGIQWVFPFQIMNNLSISAYFSSLSFVFLLLGEWLASFCEMCATQWSSWPPSSVSQHDCDWLPSQFLRTFPSV